MLLYYQISILFDGSIIAFSPHLKLKVLYYNVIYNKSYNLEELLRKVIQTQDVTKLLNDKLIFTKNINYNIRLWKKQLSNIFHQLNENKFLCNPKNPLRIKIICHILNSSVQSVYLKYIFIQPSRAKNPQYIQDLRFIIDIITHYEKGLLGIMIQYFQDQKTKKERDYIEKILNLEVTEILSVLHNFWWIKKTLDSQKIIIESSTELIQQFIIDCTNKDIILSETSEETMEIIYNICQNLIKTV